MRIVSLALISALMISSCSFVKITTEGEKVRVLAKSEVYSCKKLGTTSVSLLNKVGGIERGTKKVQTELETLARNSAPGLKGDTVVAVGEPVDGTQTFEVYRCVNPWEAQK